jgi:AcrR family transcriptional regulator
MTLNVRVMSKGEQTRQRLMDIAQVSVLQKGFAGTSLDEIITEAGITKSGFFYHFKDKNDLAKAMLERYLDENNKLFDALFAEADSLNEDPLHGFLIFLKRVADTLADMPNGHPGCLVASYCYQDHMFSRDIREMYTVGVMAWRKRFRQRLDAIAAIYPPRIPVDLDALADMFSATTDGGILLNKALNNTSLLPQQVMLYRSFVRLVFTGIG